MGYAENIATMMGAGPCASVFTQIYTKKGFLHCAFASKRRLARRNWFTVSRHAWASPHFMLVDLLGNRLFGILV